MKDIVLSITTSAGGAATVSAPSSVLGKLYAIAYIPGTLATGATLTLTCDGPSASSKPLLIKASAGTANSWYYPRDLVHGVADGVALTGTAGGDRVCPLLAGKPKVVVSAGGAEASGTLILYYEA